MLWVGLVTTLLLPSVAAINARIAEEQGVRVERDGHAMHTFPAPDRIARLPLIRGLATRKVAQLRAPGQTTADWFSRASLRAMDHEQALAQLQRAISGH